MARWRVGLAGAADRDYDEILEYTLETFGRREANIYRATLNRALADLRSGPHLPGSDSREEIGSGLRTLHAARNGRRARHLIFYRAGPEQTIEFVRILYDGLDLARHVPKHD